MSDTEHFEAHGNKWETFAYFKKEEKFSELLKEAAEKGKTFEQLKSDNGMVVPLIYPANAALGVCLLLENKAKSYEVESIYPFLEGLPVKLELTKNTLGKMG